jgi:hypothetical protein
MSALLQTVALLLAGLTLAIAASAGQQLRAVHQAAPSSTVSAAATTDPLEVWPAGYEFQRLSDIGRGKGIVFSPDFSAPGNREFYEKLGFAYFEDPRWQNVIEQIRRHNETANNKIETLIIETHGTNGNGLKLQQSERPRALRSYISIGALQEQLEPAGVRLCVLAACNSARLFRPQIYKRLNPHTRDPLFLPATAGIVNSSADFDPARSRVVMARRAQSNIDSTSEGWTNELSPIAQALLGLRSETRRVAAKPTAKPRAIRFVVSNTLIQMLLHDPPVELTSTGFEERKSRVELSDAQSDVLYQKFVRFINRVAEREARAARAASVPAATAR